MSESQPLLSQRISDAVPDAIEIPVTEAAKQVSSWTSEFFKFIAKGNVVDLAIGIIIGAAFQDIVKSLVGDIFSPVIGLATGNTLQNEFAVLKPGRSGNATYNTPQLALDDGAVPLAWGKFLQTVVNFFIVGLVLFVIVKLITAAEAAKVAAAEAEKTAATEEKKKTEKECPSCLEMVKANAKTCKFCTRDLPN